jgi:hypothetical protein
MIAQFISNRLEVPGVEQHTRPAFVRQPIHEVLSSPNPGRFSMKFRNRWFGLTCLTAALVAVLVACPAGSTTPPDNTDTAKFDTAKFDSAKFGP